MFLTNQPRLGHHLIFPVLLLWVVSHERERICNCSDYILAFQGTNNTEINNKIDKTSAIKNIVILSQSRKYNNPVYLNDTLYFKASICEIYESVSVINFKYNFINQKNIIVAKGKVEIKKLT